MRTQKNASALALLALLAVSTAVNSHGAVDAFLRFTDPVGSAVPCPGDSSDAQFPGKDGWFGLMSFDKGILNPVTFGSGGATVAKTTFRNFSFIKHPGLASPALFMTSATGGHYQQADLALRQAPFDGKPTKPFYTAKFRTIFVSSMNWSGPGDDAPNESIATSYIAIEWSFTRFDAEGNPLTTVTVNWDQVANTGGLGPFPPPNQPPTLSYPASQSVLIGKSIDIPPLTGPSDPDGVASIAILSKGGYTGGISVDSTSGIVQITDATPVGGPYTIVVRATDRPGLSIDASFNLVVNPDIPALIANADSVSRVLGSPLNIPTGTLTSNDSAGATFDGLPSDTTTLAGRVSLSGSTIIYEPPTPDPGTDDTFTYRVRDSFGQMQTGTVIIRVDNPTGPSGNLDIRVTRDATTLQLVAIPGRKYQLQRALVVTGPWDDFGDVITVDVNGSASWTDPDPSSLRFYRAYIVP
jgi:type VI protein secretion system component Hcp